MSSTKIAFGVAAAVSVAALGTTLYESRRSQAALAELATAQKSSAALEHRIAELERQLASQMQRPSTEDKRAMAISAAPEVTRTSQANDASPGETAITQDLVRKRYDRARELDRQGHFEAALGEYLWCYDVGMPRTMGFAGVRAVVPGQIAKLGEQYPPALTALRERRDAAERRIVDGAADFDAASTLINVNLALKEEKQSLDLHDRLLPDDPSRQIIGKLLFDQFLAAQRYDEAASARPFSSMSGQFEVTIGRETKGAPPPLTEQQSERARSFAIRTAAKHIEVLVGVGDLEHAADLAMRVLDHDSSPETHALLESHVARAGRPGLLAALRKE